MVAALAAAPGAARAQIESREGIALQNQILELQQEIEALRQQAGRGGAPADRRSAAPTSRLR